MPGQRFTVSLDPDDLAQFRPAKSGTTPKADRGAPHHGAHDEKQAARSRSEQARAGRAAGASGGRSYAFRRS
ncbi:hypothetical protein KOI35_46895 [Actinoplanes bogorensis]|uniref:Uncharacterized protein n=1 Tax=Paractinoplanes bogorensis TaxID=1610840 RepID=A0ABS5Z5T1_9ACTN|nr:hypothetical protein [Actinoplanes bogorensis]MBU2671050.1 hypothetical protein [Actinoplanes bogorensis]